MIFLLLFLKEQKDIKTSNAIFVLKINKGKLDLGFELQRIVSIFVNTK